MYFFGRTNAVVVILANHGVYIPSPNSRVIRLYHRTNMHFSNERLVIIAKQFQMKIIQEILMKNGRQRKHTVFHEEINRVQMRFVEHQIIVWILNWQWLGINIRRMG